MTLNKKTKVFLFSTAVLTAIVGAQVGHADEVSVENDIPQSVLALAQPQSEQGVEAVVQEAVTVQVEEVTILDSEPVSLDVVSQDLPVVGAADEDKTEQTAEDHKTEGAQAADASVTLTETDEVELKFQEILEQVHSGEFAPDPYMTVDEEEGYALLFARENIPNSGTYQFKDRRGIKSQPKVSSADLAYYDKGMTVNYDSVLETDGHQWISYISYTGARRYIAINALATATTVANNNVPKTTTTARATTTGINISIATNQVKDKTKILYAVWSDVNGQDDLKWYSADKDGKYLVKYDNHKGTGIYHVHTYSAETGKMVGLHTTTVRVTQSMIDQSKKQASPAPATPAQTIPSSGTYQFTGRSGVKAQPKVSSPDLAYYDKGMTVNYDSVLNSDGKQWLSYMSYDGNRRYVAIGNATATTPSQPATSPVATRPTTTAGKINSNVTPRQTQNTYSVGECTWGAKQAAPWAGNNWGHGNQWADSAAREGYTIGTTPSVGAVIVWQHGAPSGPGYDYGHVGVVKSINADGTLIIHESNVNGNRYVANHRGNYRYTGYENGGWVKFIYPPKGY